MVTFFFGVNINMDINLGDKFGSFRELQQAIATFLKANFVALHIRDSRTLQAAVKAKRISEAHYIS